MAGDRAGAAAGHADDLEAVPRRLRQVLHAPQRRPRTAQGSLGGQPGEEGSALRARRGARRSRGSGRAAAEIRRLQAEWKTIGPVRRNKSEAIWQRFRAACDTFFDRYKRRDEIELEAKQADREALVAELESLAPAGRRATCRGAAHRADRRAVATCSNACGRCATGGTSRRRSSGRAPIR